MNASYQGRVLIPGSAKAHALVLTEPLSFLGGIDSANGTVIDQSHAQHGLCVTGTVLVMPGCRGSSSSSNVFAESIRLHTSPVAIVLGEADEILAIGAFVAEELYGRTIPMVQLEPASLARITTGDEISIDPQGRILVRTTESHEGSTC